MEKWDYELKFDVGGDEFVFVLIENVKLVDRIRKGHSLFQPVPKEIRRFHKDSSPDWMVEEINNHLKEIQETFIPSDTYSREFVGDRFVGNYENNILLVRDRIDRKEIHIIGKSYTLEHGDMIVDALNASKKEITH